MLPRSNRGSSWNILPLWYGHTMKLGSGFLTLLSPNSAPYVRWSDPNWILSGDIESVGLGLSRLSEPSKPSRWSNSILTDKIKGSQNSKSNESLKFVGLKVCIFNLLLTSTVFQNVFVWSQIQVWVDDNIVNTAKIKLLWVDTLSGYSEIRCMSPDQNMTSNAIFMFY